MTSQEFIAKYHEYGEQAKKLNELLPDYEGFQIKRGMAHSISGFAEDLFAVYVAKKMNRKDVQFLVDKVISVYLEGRHKAKSFKPDLAIIDNNVMTHYFDMKTNLGWNRDFIGYLGEKNEFMRQLKTARPWVRFDKNNIQGLSVSEACKYQMVVVYGDNINQNLLKNNIELAKQYEHVNVHVLCPKNENTGFFEMDENAFTTMEATLNS